MLRFLSWLVSLPTLALVVIFALSNRGPVQISFWPSSLEITLPLAFLLMGIFFLGLLLGSVLTYLKMIKYRFQIRRLTREVEGLQHILAQPPQPIYPPSLDFPKPNRGLDKIKNIFLLKLFRKNALAKAKLSPLAASVVEETSPTEPSVLRKLFWLPDRNL